MRIDGCGTMEVHACCMKRLPLRSTKKGAVCDDELGLKKCIEKIRRVGCWLAVDHR
jgi:hypothetical protein